MDHSCARSRTRQQPILKGVSREREVDSIPQVAHIWGMGLFGSTAVELRALSLLDKHSAT
jgi:hypothetical protein